MPDSGGGGFKSLDEEGGKQEPSWLTSFLSWDGNSYGVFRRGGNGSGVGQSGEERGKSGKAKK